MNIQLLKAADLNEMFHDIGVPKQVTVQKVCTRARNETELREVFARIWSRPITSAKLLVQVAVKNADLFDFERSLELTENITPPVVTSTCIRPEMIGFFQSSAR